MKTLGIALYLFCIYFVVSLAASPIKHRDKCRERGINDALNMTLLVGAEMREKGKKPNWLELQTEVRKRLRVK